MDSNFLDLFIKAILGVVTYAVVLMFVRRQFGQSGYARFNSFLPLLLWIPLDLGLLFMSIFMTISTYRNWAPAEFLQDIPLVTGWFKDSEMTISDWMVIVLSVVFFVLAHKMIYSAMLVRDRLRQGQEGTRDFLFEAAGCGVLVLLFVLFMYGWESPIFVLRFAENLGVELPKDLGQIETLSQLLGKSWLLHAAYYGMPLVCLVVPVFSMYAFLGYHAALQQDDGTQTASANSAQSPAEAHGSVGGDDLKDAQIAQAAQEGQHAAAQAQAAAQSHVAQAQVQAEAAGAATERARIERDDARQRALEAERRTAEAEERTARAREAQHLAPDLTVNGANGHASNGTNGQANGHGQETQEQVQELLNQIEDERSRREQAEAERAALTLQHARNPLLQPNRADLPDQSNQFASGFGTGSGNTPNLITKGDENHV